MENIIERTEEEVLETAQETVNAGCLSRTVKVVGGIGLVTIVGVIAYKYVIKPTYAKIKARRDEEVVVDIHEVGVNTLAEGADEETEE